MNIVNRVIIVLLLLAVLVGVTLACFFPDQAISGLSNTADWFAERTTPGVDTVDRLYLVAVAAVVDVAVVLLLLLELRRPKPKEVQVQDVSGGTATVTVESIRQRLAFYIDGLVDVVKATPQVTVRGGAVAVSMDVETSAVVNVQAKARQIVQIVRMVVTESMGLQLRGEPEVRIRTGSFSNIALPPVLDLTGDEEE